MEKHPVPLVSFVNISKSGKTTFIEKSVPVLKQRGPLIAVIKRHHHDCAIDITGKDTYRFKKAPAPAVVQGY